MQNQRAEPPLVEILTTFEPESRKQMPTSNVRAQL